MELDYQKVIDLKAKSDRNVRQADYFEKISKRLNSIKLLSIFCTVKLKILSPQGPVSNDAEHINPKIYISQQTNSKMYLYRTVGGSFILR